MKAKHGICFFSASVLGAREEERVAPDASMFGVGEELREGFPFFPLPFPRFEVLCNCDVEDEVAGSTTVLVCAQICIYYQNDNWGN